MSFYPCLLVCCHESLPCPGALPLSEEKLKAAVSSGPGLLFPDGGDTGTVSILLEFLLSKEEGSVLFRVLGLCWSLACSRHTWLPARGGLAWGRFSGKPAPPQGPPGPFPYSCTRGLTAEPDSRWE